MNISYNWLKDLIDIEWSPEDLGRKLTGVGLAVEGIHPLGDDHVFDIDLTSNRPDCLSHLGVAREIAAITKVETRPVGSVPVAATDPGEASGLVSILDDDLCHRFTARVIRNVKIGPSPDWLVERLEAIGERSINNVADITNYVMHELGQPMHSFDLNKLAENRIVVRRARAGESIQTLDEVERKLDDSMLAICDAEKPVAVAGIMGGFSSSITENTVNVLLEVAYFDRANIRATSRKLNLATEASYRFERGVDIENLVHASERAADLICDLAGGERGDFVDVYPRPFEPREIPSKDISSSVLRLTGLNVSLDECERILLSLGIERRSPGLFISPSWRHDLAIEEDLVEEVARHIGYENIAAELPPAFGAGEYQETELRKKLLRQTLVDIGFDEAISYSFIDTRFDDVFQTVAGVIDDHAEEKYVTLRDSVIEGAVRMRPTILPGLLDAVRLNLNHQRRDVKLFEVGKVFASYTGESGLPNEQEVAALVLTGGESNEDRGLPGRPLDFYDAKGSVEAALAAAGIISPSFSSAEISHLRPGQSAVIEVAGKPVGSVGRLADQIAASYKFRQPVYVAELNLQTVLSEDVSPARYRPLAKYPSMVRDVSFIVKRNEEFTAVAETIRKQGFDLCRNIKYIDIYEGKGLAEDERSLTLRLEYRSDERTLLEDEVEQVHSKIVTGVERELNVSVKS
jgi:phenylalanyl-tRNA synthetase beta chain